jgi:hypothetical protein
VQLNDFPVAIEQRANHLDLANQALDVLATLRELARNDPIASAVEAGAEAIRNVHVERKLPRDRLRITALDVLAQHALAEARSKLRRCGIRGVTRPRPIVLAQHLRIECV